MHAVSMKNTKISITYDSIIIGHYECRVTHGYVDYGMHVTQHVQCPSSEQ